MMDPEVWEEVETVFQTALDLDAAERSRFLDSYPKPLVADEVRTLIAAGDRDPDFLAHDVAELAAAALDAEDAGISLAGESIGHYRLIRLLGRGGMGEVYLAEDQQLGRKVALKFLGSSLLNDSWARRQLVREARAVATLDHTNICQVYGYEEIGEHRFIVMQYVDGTSLAELLKTGSFSVAEIESVARGLVSAISEAHANGIIHRDIKPGNIMIDAGGEVKILDFGLAKLIPLKGRNSEDASGALSRPGIILGTVAYMSPEQLRADKLDERSDIFSIGTVLCEIATGKNPFVRNSDAETISAIVGSGPAVPPESETKIVPPSLRKVIRKCLQKDPDSRFQSAAELLGELQGIKTPERRRSLIKRAGIAAVAVLAAVLAIIGFTGTSGAPQSIAVLPFKNETGDAAYDYLGDGIAESVSDAVHARGILRVKTLPTSPGAGEENADPLSIGRSISADLILSGRLVRSNNQVFVRADVVNAREGIAIRGWNIPLELSALQDVDKTIADELIAGLGVEKGSSGQPARRGTFTENNEAFRQNLIGRHLWRKRDAENISQAIEAFQKAVDLDPGYARPYAGIADSYVLMTMVAYGTVSTEEAMAKARAAARRALEIDPLDAAAHTSLGVVLTKRDWNWRDAEREFRLAIEAEPDYAAAHYWYSGLLATMGRSDEAIAEARLAKELDPFSPLADLNLARVLYYGRRFDEAKTVLLDSTGIKQADRKLRYLYGLVLIQKGSYRDAQQQLEGVLAENRLLAAAALGNLYARMNREADARKLLAELEEAARSKPIPPQEFAMVYIGLGDHDNAFKYLKASVEARHAASVSLKVEPLFDPLRRDPRFDALLRSVALSP